MAVIQFEDYKSKVIDIRALRESGAARKLGAGLITPAKEDVVETAVNDRSAEPIKNMDQVEAVVEHLLSKGRYRDNMLFVVGINFGLRAGDLLSLQFANLINDNFTFKDQFAILEKKTSETRGRKKNRYITINDAVVEAVTLYLEHTTDVSLSDYMFRSESNNGGSNNEPITVRSMDRILKGIAKDVGLGMRVSTHTLRKTFCYHQMVMSGNDSRKLLLLQKIMNHSSPAITLEYIGITAEEIDEAYRGLNLGSKAYNYMAGSNIVEVINGVV